MNIGRELRESLSIRETGSGLTERELVLVAQFSLWASVLDRAPAQRVFELAEIAAMRWTRSGRHRSSRPTPGATR